MRILLRRAGFIILFIILSWGRLIAIDLSDYNCSHWYDPNAKVRVDHIISADDSTFFLSVRIVTSQLRQDSVTYFLQSNFTSKKHKVIAPKADTLIANVLQLVLELQISKADADNILIIRYQDNGDYLFPIQLRYNSVQHPDFRRVMIPNGLVSFDRYHNTDTCFFSGVRRSDTLFVYQYADQFQAAEPPMAMLFDLSPSLSRDTMLLITTDRLHLVPDHFYFVQKDTFDLGGITVFSGSQYFPRYAKLSELIPPLVYVTRKSERAKLEQSSNLRKAFDEFWLSLYPIKRNASDAIASYYNAVTEANYLFTDYKPGWKTDRGMLYIVMGRPKEVIREDWRELWVYSNELKFEFRVISNLFAYHQYYLIRKQEYEEPWFSAVRQIRNNQ